MLPESSSTGRRNSREQIADVMVNGVVFNRENLPLRVNRRTAAALITFFYGPVSWRTLERWPLVWTQFNGQAVVETVSIMEEAERRLRASPPIRGGRRISPVLPYITATEN
jgi:hypothetical protein